MYATIESEVLNCLIRTPSDDKYQYYKYCEYGLYIIDRRMLGFFCLLPLPLGLLAPFWQRHYQFQSAHFPLCAILDEV